jgi:hypothetical protein
MSTSTTISVSFSQPHDTAITDIDMSTSQNAEDSHFVVLQPEDNPQNMSLFRRWLAVLVISSAALCVTCASSIVSQFVCRDLGLVTDHVPGCVHGTGCRANVSCLT